MISNILKILRVSDARTIGKILTPLYKNEQTATVASQKELNFLVAKGDLKRGKGFYALPSYEGSYNPHDKQITNCMAQLISLGHPISLYRERSLTGGVRPDIIGLIGNKGKALAFIVEIALTEEDAYLEKKAIFWQYHNPLEEVFGIKVPPPTLVVHGKTHPGFMDFDQFLTEVKVCVNYS